VYWRPPAVFAAESYSVTVTPIGTGSNVIIGQVGTLGTTFTDVFWANTAGARIDTDFCLQAGGKIVVV
jgi:hypothetical protein